MPYVIFQRTEQPIIRAVAGVDYQLPGLFVREINRHKELVVDDDKTLALRFDTRKEAETAVEEATSSVIGCEVVELRGPNQVDDPCTPAGFMLRALDTGARSREEIRKHLPEHLAVMGDETLDQLRKEVIHLVKTKTKPKAKGGNGRVKKEVVLRNCHCGCGGQARSNFLPGHDARVYSLLRKEAKGEKVTLPSALTGDGDLLKAMRAKVH